MTMEDTKVREELRKFITRDLIRDETYDLLDDEEETILRGKLRDFITRDLIRDETYDLLDDEGIISGGLMDSFALAELAVYVESEFDVYIPDADLTVAKMDTLDQIVGRVMRGDNRK